MSAAAGLNGGLPCWRPCWTTVLSAVLVVAAVPLALVGYILLIECDRQAACRGERSGARPWLWLAPALTFLGVFLVYPTIATIVRSFQNRRGDEFAGAENYIWFFTRQRHADRPAEQRAVGGAPAAARRRPRTVGRGPGRPREVREHGEVGRLPADGDQLRRRGRDLATDVRAGPEDGTLNARDCRRVSPSPGSAAPRNNLMLISSASG